MVRESHLILGTWPLYENLRGEREKNSEGEREREK